MALNQLNSAINLTGWNRHVAGLAQATVKNVERWLGTGRSVPQTGHGGGQALGIHEHLDLEIEVDENHAMLFML